MNVKDGYCMCVWYTELFFIFKENTDFSIGLISSRICVIVSYNSVIKYHNHEALFGLFSCLCID